MKKKFVKLIIVAIMLMITCSTIVNALSFTATMTPSSTTVAESTEFTISIKVSNLDVGQNGINTLSGYLKYDTSVFETISESSIEGLNNWSPSFNSENGKITLTKTTFVKTEEAVFQITFKTKSGISGKTGSISYTNILASNSEEEISATDISTTITVGTTPTNTTPVNNTQVIVPIVSNTTNTAKNTIKINTTTNQTTTNKIANNKINTGTTANYVSSDDIPYTGVEDTVMYIMIVVLALAMIFYVKYQKINRDLK